MQHPKSRSLIRVARRTPGGRTVIHFRQRKTGKARCAQCKSILHGVRQDCSLSGKRVARPYGGYLCSCCTKRIFIEKARQ